MGLTSDELQRLAEDILFERLISTNLFCANCGYNLRTLGYAGRCPECGSEYNARKLWMEGVFTAGMLEFPTGDWFGAVLTGGLGVLLAAWGTNPVVGWRLMFAVVLLLLAGFYVRSAWRRTGRYLHFQGIARRIKAAEEE